MKEQYTFGVCRCNMGDYDPKVRNLEKFPTYEEACNRYTQLATNEGSSVYTPTDLWIVWIDEKNTACQFDRLKAETQSKLIPVDNRKGEKA